MVSGVIGGVDTHADVHVAAALDTNGAVLGIESFRVNEPAIGVGGLAARRSVRSSGLGWRGPGRMALAWPDTSTEGVEVVEVDRPNRQKRRKLGKSDPIDAEAAAEPPYPVRRR